MAAKSWFMASALGLTIFGVTIARSQSPATGGEIPFPLVERLSPGTVLEQYLASTLAPLRSADRSGDGLDRTDVMLARGRALAQSRAAAVGQVLTFDLDGDFRITREEVAQFAVGEDPNRHRQGELTFQRFDANEDGVITLADAADAADDPTGELQVEALLPLDPNGDGRLMAAELGAIAERAFAQVDRDSDGKISAEEYKAIEERVREAQIRRTAPRCELPPVPAGAQLVVFGGYESDAVSSVSVGGPDQETNFIDVTIEPGSTPLYLVLTSYESMIWRVSGATGRVAQVVLASYHSAKQAPGTAAGGSGIARQLEPRKGISAAGVIGLRSNRVTIAPSGCPGYFHKSESGEAKRALASLRGTLGREPDAIFATYSARRIWLPSGALEQSPRDSAPVPPGFDAATWPEAARFWTGGLVTVDPARVVARTRVERYSVLPSQMGISQLVGSGHLQRLPSGSFRLVKPIANMPPSMGGAHSVKLIIAKGVPVPPGDRGHSCVISEETGAELSGASMCRTSD